MNHRVKLLEHAMKIVERVLQKQIQTLISSNKVQFEFTPGIGTVDAIFIVRRMQEEYQKKDKKLYMCLVGTEKAFDRVPRKVIKVDQEKEGFVRSNGLSSYELA